jgi:SAM-dependent methyltransferase
MSKLMLDIGAGGSSFARLFRKYNPHLDVTVLCGEPSWRWLQRLSFGGSVKAVESTYNKFAVADDSLDIITLNAFHPYFPPHGIETEVLRCLKKGGLFFSAHPAGMVPKVSLQGNGQKLLTELVLKGATTGLYTSAFTFERVERRSFRYESILTIGKEWGTVRYPASPTVADRLNVLSFPHLFSGAQLNSYIYQHIRGEPALRVWVRE